MTSSQSVFVLELVSAGYFGDDLAPNFRAEGRAMLDAVLDDFRRIANVTVSTIGNDTTLLRSVAKVRADAALVIAPEFDRLLARFCEAARESGARSLNCDPQALSLCADKARFATHLAERQILTIPTQLLGLDEKPNEFPCVVKPRDGAGSWLVRTVSRRENWPKIVDEYRSAGRTELLCQPWIRGKSYSVAAMISPDRAPELLPVADQRLSVDCEFHYLGGEIPARISDETARSVHRLVGSCLESISGLHGYIGCDVIVPDHDSERPLLVELNPRLTTSYIGYRQLCADNLMERLLYPDRFAQTLQWRDGSVSFDSCGACRYASTLSP
jgi:hypothetical protein